MIIKPLVGIGDIALGSSKNKVEALIGKPDKIIKEDLEDGAYSEEWKYPTLGLELYFIGSDALDYISVTSSKAELDGIYPIGLDIDALTKQIPEIEFEDDFEDNEAVIPPLLGDFISRTVLSSHGHAHG